MTLFQQIRAELETGRMERRKLIATALHAMRRFLSLRRGPRPLPPRHDR
jgi:hypothetical protein